MSLKQWYNFSLLMARHVNMEKAIYRVRLNREQVFYQKNNHKLCSPPDKLLLLPFCNNCRECQSLMIVRASVTVEWTKKIFLLSGQKACLTLQSA